MQRQQEVQVAHALKCASIRIHLRPMAQLVVPDKGGGVHLARKLTLGSELSCTTIHGDTFRGNLMAQDDEARLIVLSILPLVYTPTFMYAFRYHCK